MLCGGYLGSELTLVERSHEDRLGGGAGPERWGGLALIEIVET